MNTQEKKVFIEAVKTLEKEFEKDENFDLVIEVDRYHPGEGGNYHVVIIYGEVRSEFVTCGYSFAYNMQRLFNNVALNKILR